MLSRVSDIKRLMFRLEGEVAVNHDTSSLCYMFMYVEICSSKFELACSNHCRGMREVSLPNET